MNDIWLPYDLCRVFANRWLDKNWFDQDPGVLLQCQAREQPNESDQLQPGDRTHRLPRGGELSLLIYALALSRNISFYLDHVLSHFLFFSPLRIIRSVHVLHHVLFSVHILFVYCLVHCSCPISVFRVPDILLP